MSRSVGVVTLLASTAAISCASEPYALPIDQQRPRVSAAQVDQDERWSGVVYLSTAVNKSNKVCTGTLVAPDLVLTALHCMAELSRGDIQCTYEGDPVEPGVGDLGPPVGAENVTIRVGVNAAFTEAVASGVKLFTTNSSNICTNDIALVQLDVALDLPIRPLRLEKATVRGEPLTIIGYGMTDVTGDLTARRYRSDVRVLEIGNDANTGPRALTPPRTLSVEPSACQGDSGGPAVAQTGDYPIVGVNSLVLSECGSESADGVYTRLVPFKNLILEAFAAVGAEPWLEGHPLPGSEPPPTDAAVDTHDPDTETTSGGAPYDSGAPKPSTGAGQGRRLTSGCAITANSGAEKGLPWLLVVAAASLIRPRLRRGRRH